MKNLNEWDYISQGEDWVVAALIRQRSRQDCNYYLKTDGVGALDTTGTIRFSEQVICVYVDLDRLLDTCGQSKGQQKVVDMLMYGYSVSDIADALDVPRSTVSIQFKRAVSKVVKRNNEVWEQTYAPRAKGSEE